ncbi:MAG: wax ester/triacylglycerol synthase family O-acyltransferase [Pseudomonadota bacterium]
MRKARAFDASWLHFETGTAPLHVASLPIFRRPDGVDADDFFRSFREMMTQKRHYVDAYTLKRKHVAGWMDHPVWVRDTDIDMTYHVRRITLPRPTIKALETVAERLAAMPMDLDRPLWQYTIVDGLPDNQFGVFMKMHHSVIDGQSGAAILQDVFDPSPEPREIKPVAPDFADDPIPSEMSLIAGSVENIMGQQFALAGRMSDYLQASRTALSLLQSSAAGESDMPLNAPPTLFNRAISDRRRYKIGFMSVKEAKAIKTLAGVTLNDVVLSVTGGALRRYLDEHQALPEESLVASVPISVRKPGEDTKMGAQLSMLLCGLGTQIVDPLERLLAVHGNAETGKAAAEAMQPALTDDYALPGAPIAMRAAAELWGATRMADWAGGLGLMPFNLVVSNVAGPRNTLYLNGAEMLHYHPVSVVAHGQGLNVTVQSYRDSLGLGVLSCRELMPDLDRLMTFFNAEFEALKAQVSAGAEAQLHQTKLPTQSPTAAIAA